MAAAPRRSGQFRGGQGDISSARCNSGTQCDRVRAIPPGPQKQISYGLAPLNAHARDSIDQPTDEVNLLIEDTAAWSARRRSNRSATRSSSSGISRVPRWTACPRRQSRDSAARRKIPAADVAPILMRCSRSHGSALVWALRRRPPRLDSASSSIPRMDTKPVQLRRPRHCNGQAVIGSMPLVTGSELDRPKPGDVFVRATSRFLAGGWCYDVFCLRFFFLLHAGRPAGRPTPAQR